MESSGEVRLDVNLLCVDIYYVWGEFEDLG